MGGREPIGRPVCSLLKANFQVFDLCRGRKKEKYKLNWILICLILVNKLRHNTTS